MRGSISRRYARALIEVGIDKGSAEQLLEQVTEYADLYSESRELRNVLSNPAVKLEERRGLVRAIGAKAGWNQFVTNFGLLLLDNDRAKFLPGVALELSTMYDEHVGNVRASVTSARDLSGSRIEEIKKAIADMTGKNVILETEVNPELIGGVITRVGSVVYDGSVRNQLNNLRESILDEV
jgi:F-type H+-transporting ATPase subunit delta